MTVQARWTLVASVLALVMAGPAWGVQTGERVFGQLKPGQSVVEINQADTLLDDGWSPVAQVLPPESLPKYPEKAAPTTSRTTPTTFEQQPVPESLAAPIDPSPTPPAIDNNAASGLNILEALARREAEADAASARYAARLAAEREQAATLNAIAGTEPNSPSNLQLANLPPQERQTLGGSTSPDNTATSDTETAVAPSTNFIADWFRGLNATAQTLLSLGVVVLLIYSLAWVYRKSTMNRGGVAGVNSNKAPSGLLEVLGRYPLGNKQSLVLLKFDRRVLLLSQGPSGKGGVEMKTLCELDQPEDVASVLMKVRDADGESLNKAFRSAMSKAELGAAASERMIEPKSAPVRPVRPSAPPRSVQVEPKTDVVPGHRDPFNGFGGDFVRPTRQVSVNPEGDRSELWGTPPSGTVSPAHDPVASLKQRLEAMRRGERVK